MMKTMKEYADEYARKHNVKITKVTDYSFVAKEYPKRDGIFPYKKSYVVSLSYFFNPSHVL